MARAFPELLQLRNQRYVLSKVIRFVRIYQLKPSPHWSASALAFSAPPPPR